MELYPEQSQHHQQQPQHHQQQPQHQQQQPQHHQQQQKVLSDGDLNYYIGIINDLLKYPYSDQIRKFLNVVKTQLETNPDRNNYLVRKRYEISDILNKIKVNSYDPTLNFYMKPFITGTNRYKYLKYKQKYTQLKKLLNTK